MGSAAVSSAPLRLTRLRQSPSDRRPAGRLLIGTANSPWMNAIIPGKELVQATNVIRLSWMLASYGHVVEKSSMTPDWSPLFNQKGAPMLTLR